MELNLAPIPPSSPTAPISTKSYPCHCPSDSSSSGLVLLFYRYYANNPTLPSDHQTLASQPESLATFHQHLATPLNLTGKLRLAAEGFNITIAGTQESIETYMTACTHHWSFANLDLSTAESRRKFFKPTPGCACVFPSLSVRVCEEITPMAVSKYSPADWSAVGELEPEEWHELLQADAADEVVLLDVRNHYESALGYFVGAGGRAAVRPQVRRFSQFPQYVRRRGIEGEGLSGSGKGRRKVLSYCTGGIRCEKATRFMQENLPGDTGQEVEVFTLKGGIAAYMAWVDGEIRGGRAGPGDSLFKGKNYVFDGRGSVGLEFGRDEVVGRCIRCHNPADGIQKCESAGCKLELIVCSECKEKEGLVVCCQDCRDLDFEGEGGGIGAKRMCQCEKDREAKLWGANIEGVPRTQGWKSKRRRDMTINKRKEPIGIQVQMIQPNS